MSCFEESMVWRHLDDNTECCHRLAEDERTSDGFYCVVTHSDVVLDDGGPRTGKITVVLADDEPAEQVFPTSRYLGPQQRGRHRAETPDMRATWPEGFAMLGVWSAFSGVIVGGLIGVVWLIVHVSR